jgi:hypothetical protein
MATVRLEEFSPRIDHATFIAEPREEDVAVRIASWQWAARVAVQTETGESVKVGFIQTSDQTRLLIKTMSRKREEIFPGPRSDRYRNSYAPWYESSSSPVAAGVSPEVRSAGSTTVTAQMVDMPRTEVPWKFDGEYVTEVIDFKKLSTWLAACITDKDRKVRWVTLAATTQEIGCRLRIHPFDGPSVTCLGGPSILISHGAPFPRIPHQAFLDATISQITPQVIWRPRKPVEKRRKAWPPESD